MYNIVALICNVQTILFTQNACAMLMRILYMYTVYSSIIRIVLYCSIILTLWIDILSERIKHCLCNSYLLVKGQL